MKQTQFFIDKDITLVIEEELALDEGVAAYLIDVETTDGIVVLTGEVSNLLVLKRALELIERIRGVRAVVNRLQVKPIIRPNAEIYQDIQQALMLDATTQQYKVKAEVKEGVVTLAGRVSSWRRKQIVAWVVQGIKGVRDVDNNIEIEYVTTRLDAEIKKDVDKISG